ncbi:MAG TPA: hypothetical protein VJ739_05940 [Gemmataceae bacterium]|nr:hypothetical protein [Gemmataceae bacterium]
MLPLDSKRWSELSHAYGDASDLPSLLAELKSLPPDAGSQAEPYFSLWSALCHQGDVYTASYAAVPHIVRVMDAAPERVPMTLFLMVACIEIARSKGRGPPVPPDLQADYAAELARIPELVGRAARARWDHWYCGAALAAVAAAKGFAQFAEAVLELDPETVKDVLRWKLGEE